MVWFLAIIGGTVADKLGFRRALSLAYLILTTAYFLLGSIGASWMAAGPQGHAALACWFFLILMLPALGVAMVKPSVVGTTASSSKENVRSIGYSIYYTLGEYRRRRRALRGFFCASPSWALKMFFAWRHSASC